MTRHVLDGVVARTDAMVDGGKDAHRNSPFPTVPAELDKDFRDWFAWSNDQLREFAWSNDQLRETAGLKGRRLLRAPDGSYTALVEHETLPLAVERGLPGVWLTPILTEASIATAVRDLSAPSLLVGGWHRATRGYGRSPLKPRRPRQDGFSVHPGGLHGHVGHTQTTKPVDQVEQVRGGSGVISFDI
ncbi:MAG: hypothetical protein ACYDDU_00645 [Dermatophilaceae bacterium]